MTTDMTHRPTLFEQYQRRTEQEDQAWEWIKKHAPNQFAMFEQTWEFPLKRGSRGQLHAGSQVRVMRTPAQYRPARNISDVYKSLCDSVSCPPFPRRGYSVVTSTGFAYASSYGPSVVYIVPREDTVLGNANNRDLHDTDIIGNISYGIGSFVGVIEQILDAFFSPTGDNEETTKLRAAGNGIYDMMDEYPKSWEHIDDINATIRGTLTVYGDALRKIGKDREAVLAAVSMDRRSPFCTYMFDHLWGPSSYDIRDTPNFQHLCNYATYGCTTLLAANIAEEATSRYTGTEVWFEGEYAIVPAEYSRYE